MPLIEHIWGAVGFGLGVVVAVIAMLVALWLDRKEQDRRLELAHSLGYQQGRMDAMATAIRTMRMTARKRGA